MAWLLDTNILSEGRKPKPEKRVTSFYQTQPLNTLYISVVSIAEIRFGIEFQKDMARRAELTTWLRLTLLPTCGPSLAGYGRYFAQVESAYGGGPQDGSHPDLLIAATALQHGLRVVTRDRSDFDKARVPVFNPLGNRVAPSSNGVAAPPCRHFKSGCSSLCEKRRRVSLVTSQLSCWP